MSERPQLFSEKCSSCIFRPGNRMQLAPGRLADVVESNLAEGTMLICHQTLYGEHPEIGPTMCAGYWASYASTSRVVQVMERLYGPGWYAVVDPPAPGATGAR